jgi:hypothetical protein
MKQGLFGYYQNAVDYINEFVRAYDGWTPAEWAPSGTVAYQKGQYRIEVSLIQATGVDLSKETYLFQELEHEKTEA